MKNLLLFISLVIPFAAYSGSLPVTSREDSIKAITIVNDLKLSDSAMGEKMVQAASALIDAGKDDFLSTDSIGDLKVNLGSFTPLMLINNVIALSKASMHPGSDEYGAFSKELENIACRRGENTGFPSIMFHGADWIADNVSRGNIRELTENYSGAVFRTKSLDEMTRYRKNFAALADSARFETVRMTEMGFRTHRIPYLKKETIKKKEISQDLREGDIIILVPGRDGIDIYDMGLITLENGVPYLIHFSPRTETVVKEKDDLIRYMDLVTKHFIGYRLLRVNE